MITQKIYRLFTRLHYGLRHSKSGFDKTLNDLTGDRDIEWSWIGSSIPSGPGEALDFGAGKSWLALLAARRGFNVVSVDLVSAEKPYIHPRLKSIKGDILKLTFPQNSFSLVINCSSVEHVGLSGRYGIMKNQMDGDLDAMSHLRSLMTPGGIMLLTIPVGQDMVFRPLHRVYGPERLPKLLKGYTVLREEYWLKDASNKWTLVDQENALKTQPHERLYGLGCFTLEKPTNLKE